MINTTHLFYSGILTLTTDYKGVNDFKLALGSTRMVKFKAPSANVANVLVSFRGADEALIDTEVLPGEELSLDHFQTAKISVKSSGAGTVRIWAY